MSQLCSSSFRNVWLLGTFPPKIIGLRVFQKIYLIKIRCLFLDYLKFENKYTYTVDSRYLEFDGIMEKIRVNRSSTQEELWKYRKCSLFNNERETTRAKFWRAKTSIACLDSRFGRTRDKIFKQKSHLCSWFNDKLLFHGNINF